MTETRYYLEVTSPEQLLASPEPRGPLRLAREASPSPALMRSLYKLIGENFNWVDRGRWNEEDWAVHVVRPGVEIWLLWVEDKAAGFFELLPEADSSVRLVYFGLAPEFIGRGLGGYLLTAAAQRGFEL